MPRWRSPHRRRSRSTTRAFTSSRRTSPRRCSGRSCRATLPGVPGLELGHVYESSAHVDVGGDLYDFLLARGRAPRSRARRRPRQGHRGRGGHGDGEVHLPRARPQATRSRRDFLAQANEVAFDEIELGKFITMLYVVVDPIARLGILRERRSSAAPPGRPDGRVTAARCCQAWRSGSTLDQEYPEQKARASSPARTSSSTRTAIIEAGGAASSTARAVSTLPRAAREPAGPAARRADPSRLHARSPAATSATTAPSSAPLGTLSSRERRLRPTI